MFGMIKMEMRRKSYLPEVMVILNTNDVNGDKLLLKFLVNSVVDKAKKFNGILKPIENEKDEVDVKFKVSLVSTILFPTEDKLQSFQREMEKGGCF